MQIPNGVFLRFVKRFFPVYWKETNELKYWKEVRNNEGFLSSSHYIDFFYTNHFEKKSYYENKVLLDIGCEPQGSLEWVDMASRRIGLDPLAKEYLKLGAEFHQMEYVDLLHKKYH